MIATVQEASVLRKFEKVSITDEDTSSNHYFYERSFGELVFLSGDNDEAKVDGSWYVATPCQSLKFRSYSELKTVRDIFLRNLVL